MLLEGVVTNVANFGAFVDIGVHQDGLVHVSQLADRFVKDPRDVVKAGDIVKVKVVDDRPETQAHRADDEAAGARGCGSDLAVRPAPKPAAAPPRPSAPTTSMGAAFSKLSRSQ